MLFPALGGSGRHTPTAALACCRAARRPAQGFASPRKRALALVAVAAHRWSPWALRRGCGPAARWPWWAFLGSLAVWGCAVAGFSLLSSRSLVVSRGSALPLSAPWWRRLVGSALAAGACRWRVRASARSFSGAVVVAGFASSAAASAFAAAWSSWVGFPVAVRRFRGAAGPVFGVSVPVACPPSLVLAAPAALPAVVGWVRA